MKPELSIIVPVYKVEKYLERCIDSLVNQTLKNVEIILIDDGSPDNSGNICDLYAKKFNNIVVVHKKNEGSVMARNTGLDIAKGKWIGFVDSDDYIDLNMYEEMINVANDEDADIVSCRTSEYDYIFQCNDKYKVFSGEQLLEIVFGMVGNTSLHKNDLSYGMSVWRSIFKNEIINKNNIRFFSERECSSEDMCFNVTYFSKINKAVYMKNGFYHYTVNMNSLSNTFYPEKIDSEVALYHLISNIYKNNYKYNDSFEESSDRLLIAKMKSSLNKNSVSFAKSNKILYIENIKKIVNYPEVHTAVSRFKKNNLKMKDKILYYLIQHKNIYILSLLYKIKAFKK